MSGSILGPAVRYRSYGGRQGLGYVWMCGSSHFYVRSVFHRSAEWVPHRGVERVPLIGEGGHCASAQVRKLCRVLLAVSEARE